MTVIIKDGTGTGAAVKVSSDNMLSTTAVTETQQEHAITAGDGYNLASGRLPLTSTDESAIFYVENTETADLVINSVFINTSNSAGTLVGAQPTFRVYRNPTGGTIVSDATDVLTISNNNFGSRQTLSANIYQGGEGKTLTGQTSIIDIPIPTRAAVTFIEFTIKIVLPKGASFGITYQPETGSTGLDVIAGVTAILVQGE